MPWMPWTPWFALVAFATGWPDHRELSIETLQGGHSSPRYKQDIIKLFRSQRFGRSTAMDIGAGTGYTTAALAVNFGTVLATETYWTLAESAGKGYHLDAGNLTKRDGSVPANIVRLNLDAKLPYSFAILVEQNITAAVIDAQHDFTSIARETFVVLRYVPCCVETIVYHDYCDNEVHRSIQYFVEAGLLTFRTFVGTRTPPVWCNDPALHSYRPEAVAMRVLRHRPDFRTKLEALHRLWIGKEAFSLSSVSNDLDGSRWLLVTANKQLRLLTLRFYPHTCDWRHIEDLDRATDLQQFFRSSSAMLASLSVRNLPLVIIRQQGHSSYVIGEVDREMKLISLDVSSLAGFKTAMGFRVGQWNSELLRLLDHFMHVDGALSTASSAWRDALFGR
ncbi:unnamed protein product [Symbiodinium natans]|uniref:Methyltransferase domain-containing protein n=1 Tax=Symbiodinium natans TaxID=878477 RepID=A0A812KMT8_9DINO|nr:unnamed protein product [Symbiodinium natans]